MHPKRAEDLIVWKGNPDLSPLLVPLHTLDPDSENAHIHPEPSLLAIGQSLATFGQAKPAVGWKRSPGARTMVMAGNGTMACAIALGWTHLAVSIYPGDEVHARAYALADNKSAELATWDHELANRQIEDISARWTVEEVIAEVEEIPAWEPEPIQTIGYAEPSNDIAPPPVPVEPPAPAVDVSDVYQGALYALGSHRLICGDSTVPDVITTLMNGERAALLHSDPPYGLGKNIANDQLRGERLNDFLEQSWTACRPALLDNASAYIWGQAPELWSFWYRRLAAIRDVEPVNADVFSLQNEIVWDKGAGAARGRNSEDMRSFPLTTERALFFMLGRQDYDVDSVNYWEGWEPLRSALAGELERSGWKYRDIDRITDTSTMAKHWFSRSQWVFITERCYLTLQEAGRELNVFQYPYADVRAIYEALKLEHDKVKETFYASRAFFDNIHEAPSADMVDVWKYPSVRGEDRWGHPTPKPVALCVRAIKSSCPAGAIVLEPFAGSGSTLIAAEDAGRRCFTVEIEPRYVATTIRRWEQHTGRKAERLT